MLIPILQALTGSASAPQTPEEPPSVLKQTRWPCGFYHFQTANQFATYFNPTIVEAFGKRILVARRYDGVHGGAGHNTLVMFDIVNDTPVNRRPIRFQQSIKDDNFEDPRAFMFRDRLVVSGCMFRRRGRFATQFIGLVGNNGVGDVLMHPVYGKNGPDVMSNSGNEKNWTWFEYDNTLMLLYHCGEEQRVVTFKGMKPGQEYRSVSAFETEWHRKYGQPRGGSNPILVGDEYWTFFHSSVEIPGMQRRRYHMGALAFSSEPPFNITRATTKPLLTGSFADPHTRHNPPVVFPGGAILAGGEWTVVFGVNDFRCAWIKIPFLDVADLMRVYPFSVMEQSINETTPCSNESEDCLAIAATEPESAKTTE